MFYKDKTQKFDLNNTGSWFSSDTQYAVECLVDFKIGPCAC